MPGHERCPANLLRPPSKTGKHYACQGNILTGEAVVNDMGTAFEEAKGSLAWRMIAALEAAEKAGGDSRGKQSAAILVVREKAPHGVGAMQLFVEADGRHFLGENTSHDDTWIRVALFDVIANNADRKSGHCLFDGDDNVWVIDHGLTFHVDNKLRTVIWDFSGQPLPGEMCVDIERALVEVERGGLAETLKALLSPPEVRLLKRRLRGVLEPAWRFPEPTSAWSIPWPPV